MAMVLQDSSNTQTTNNNNNKTTVDYMMSHKSLKKWGNHPGVASIFKLSCLPTNSGIAERNLVTKSKRSK
jgi:hypothetical protein